jgi:PIN domain nuclease of toxin-antitoxin system
VSRLLLDTHVFLWWQADDRRLRATARTAIRDARIVFVSVASAWEAAVKDGLGKLTLAVGFETGVRQAGFEKLPISFAHAEALVKLPAHHRDPFDRMLIVQAQAESLVLVTHDRQFEPYDLTVLWT